MTETKSKPNNLLAVFIFSLCIPMQFPFQDTPGLSIGGFTVELKYFFAAAIVLTALFYVLAKPEDLPFYGRCAGDAAVLNLPLLITLLISVLIWVFNVSELKQVTRGISQTVYKFLVLLTGLSLVIMFRERAVIIHLFSMLAAYVLYCCMTWIGTYSIAEVGRDYLRLITSFANTTPESMLKVEYHDMCFGFGLYMLYFLICRKKKSEKTVLFLLTLLAFSFGMKRIVLPAAALGLLLFLIGRKLPADMRKNAVRVYGILLFAGACVYVYLIHCGLFETVTGVLNINTMRRNEIYDYFSGYYRISPAFMGFGLGFIERFIEALPRRLFITALHNDFLKMYIELGFWGYLIWLLLSYLTLPSFFMKRRNHYTGLVFISLAAFSFVTYLTDNTYVYFIFNLAVYTSVFSCACVTGTWKDGK